MTATLGGAAAALAFALVAAVALRWPGRRWWFVAAAIATAIWGGTIAVAGPSAPMTAWAGTLRDGAWLAFALSFGATGAGTMRAAWPLAIAVALAMILSGLAGSIAQAGHALQVRFLLAMVASVGGLVLVHKITLAFAPEARGRIAGAVAGIAALWSYDLALATASYLAHDWVVPLLDARGLAAAVTAVAFGLAARERDAGRMRLSRDVAMRGLGLGVAIAYVLVVLAISTVLDTVGGERLGAIQVLLFVGAVTAAITVLPSPGARAWLNVMAAKHLFAHRYDYRSAWLRFTETLGSPDPNGPALKVRVAKAMGEIMGAPGALLLRCVDGVLEPAAAWRWPHDHGGVDAALTTTLAAGRIVAVDDATAPDLPDWVAADAWAIVPIIHFDTLVGAAALARPAVARALDWEDFDLLRVAGRQAASYLAEAQGADALAEAQRFEEFNRRFAFIMHDIKNLVSQLALLARNAERHANNPAFRADMVATLHASTARLNDLLARLAQHHNGKVDAPRSVAVGALVETVAAPRRARHPVLMTGDPAVCAMADANRLDTALGHLLDNAIDASPPAEPVTIAIAHQGARVAIAIIDRGTGMSRDFVRGDLFRPFTSTKDGGFGIGAYEARALIAAMGGTLRVDSTPGVGTTFTIDLPAATQWQKGIAA